MEPEQASSPAADMPPPAPAAAGSSPAKGPGRLHWITGGFMAVLLLAIVFLWQKLDHVQSELARRSTDSATFAMEARATAKSAQDTARDTAARLGVAESRLAEVSLQRTQLDELVQSLSRARDENLVVDIESALKLAQQQAQLLGSTEPLIAALKTAEQRLARVNQPRLAPVARAIARDQDKLKAAKTVDIGSIIIHIDEVIRQVDELPLAQDLISNADKPGHAPAPGGAVQTMVSWSGRVWQEFKSLVRIRRLDNPDAALLSPQQSFFARENLKLKLLNARLGLLSRQFGSAGTDLQNVQTALARYFDTSHRSVQITRERLGQAQSQLQHVQLPRIDDTLAALGTAAAGK